MSTIRTHPCTACPYRRDVPSGVWSDNDYNKLSLYDEPTFAQPFQAFSCHATPDRYCHGWAVVHTSRGHEYDLLALRFRDCGEIPEAAVELFGSGTEAAEHGKRDAEAPGDDAVKTVARLKWKYTRLRDG